MSADVFEPDSSQVIECGAQPDNSSDVRRARFKLVGELVVERLFKCDRPDHVAATLVRRHRIEKLAFAVQHSNAGWAINLVPGKGVEITVERADIDRPVGDCLGAIDQHRHIPAVSNFHDRGRSDSRSPARWRRG